MKYEEIEKTLSEKYGEEVLAREVLVKEVVTDKNKFNAYKLVTTDGRLIDLKFPKAADNVPEKHAIIAFYKGDYNIDKTRKYPCIWIQDVIEVFDYKQFKASATDEI